MSTWDLLPIPFLPKYGVLLVSLLFNGVLLWGLSIPLPSIYRNIVEECSEGTRVSNPLSVPQDCLESDRPQLGTDVPETLLHVPMVSRYRLTKGIDLRCQTDGVLVRETHGPGPQETDLPEYGRRWRTHSEKGSI